MRRFTANQLAAYRGSFNWGDVCACIYCGGDVEVTDWADGDRPQENLGLADHHFGCWHSGRFDGDGRYGVIGNLDCHNQQLDQMIRFPWANRAIHQAQDWAQWNNDTSVYVVVDGTDGSMVFSIQGQIRTRKEAA